MSRKYKVLAIVAIAAIYLRDFLLPLNVNPETKMYFGLLAALIFIFVSIIGIKFGCKNKLAKNFLQ